MELERYKIHPIISKIVDWDNLQRITMEKNIKNLEYIAKGHRGVVFKGYLGNKIVCIKVPRNDSKNTILHEGNILKEVNKYNIGPKLIDYSEKYLIMEYIDGISLKDYLNKWNNVDKNIIKKSILETIKQCIILDKIKIDHTEIQGGKHIIITKNKEIVIIDFDKSRITNKVHNFTSAMSLFFGKNHISNIIYSILSKDDFKDIMMGISKIYKNTILK